MSLIVTNAKGVATGFATQRMCFYTKGRHWVFFGDDPTPVDIVYISSMDGINWTSPTLFKKGTDSYMFLGAHIFTLYFDGVYVHTFYYKWYRRGLPNYDGTITWDTEHEILPAELAYAPLPCSITLDSEGYAWIGYANDSPGYPYISKSSVKPPSFTHESGFPYKLRNEEADYWQPIVLPLTNGKVYVIYGNSETSALYGRLWNGSMGDEEEIATDKYELYYSAVSVNDDVYLVYLDTNNNLKCMKRTYGEGWSDFGTIYEGAGYFGCAASSDKAGHLHAIFTPTQRDRLKLSKYITEWQEKDLVTGQYHIFGIFSFLRQYANTIGVLWATELDGKLNIWYKIVAVLSPALKTAPNGGL